MTIKLLQQHNFLWGVNLYDIFLRDLWLECCGHLSSFIFDKVEYKSYSSDDYNHYDDSFEDFIEDDEEEIGLLEDDLFVNCDLECNCHNLSKIFNFVVTEIVHGKQVSNTNLDPFEMDFDEIFTESLIQAIQENDQFKNFDFDTVTAECKCSESCYSHLLLKLVRGGQVLNDIEQETDVKEDDDNEFLEFFEYLFGSSLSTERIENHSLMDIKIKELLDENIKKIYYVYDYGSTTDLEITNLENVKLPQLDKRLISR